MNIKCEVGFRVCIIQLCVVLVCFGCNQSLQDRSIELKYQTYCGSCHLKPNPKNITKSIWEEKVLPEMAARLGLKVNSYNPMARNSMEENMYIRRTNTYPKQSQVDSITWKQIHDFVIDLAPDSIPIDKLRLNRSSALHQFKSHQISIDEIPISKITNVKFEKDDLNFIVSDAYGRSYKWTEEASLSWMTFNSPLIDFHQDEEVEYFTQIGYMNPTEKPAGTIWRKSIDGIDTLATELHRPVYTQLVDLNEDGVDEIVICEFGNLGGKLSLMSTHGDFEKRTLLPVPGTIKTEVYDMNGDGLKDIIVLASQGREGVYILYQDSEFEFTPSLVIEMGPEYGSSWFELIDYDKDGDMDIVLANGDNADYSIFPKPYHGVRLFLNNEEVFNEVWFYPIYGATRVLTEDFDLDGDLDFAVMSFFPEYESLSHESFVYLENVESNSYLFEPYTIDGLPPGRWLVMDKGDIDKDGDVDLLMGSFILPPERNRTKLLNNWREQEVDLLYLENTTKFQE